MCRGSKRRTTKKQPESRNGHREPGAEARRRAKTSKMSQAQRQVIKSAGGIKAVTEALRKRSHQGKGDLTESELV